MTTTATATSYECACGIRRDEHGNLTLWIESPKTGHRLSIGGGWRKELDQAAPRLWARVVKTRGEGRHTARFTLIELQAVKALADRIAGHCRPVRRVGGPTVHAFTRYGGRC